ELERFVPAGTSRSARVPGPLHGNAEPGGRGAGDRPPPGGGGPEGPEPEVRNSPPGLPRRLRGGESGRGEGRPGAGEGHSGPGPLRLRRRNRTRPTARCAEGRRRAP